jgi:hypothetical protein
MLVVSAAAPAAMPVALQAAAEAHRQSAAVVNRVAASLASTARTAWLHTGHHPSPLMTAMVRPLRPASGGAALRSPQGRLLTSCSSIATCPGAHCAAVSGTSRDMQQLVLAALRQQLGAGMA